MPSIRTFLGVGVAIAICMAFAPASSWADPDDMSAAAYEQSQRRAEQRARARAETEFEDRIAEVTALGNPGVIGEEITVRLLRGGRPTATGRLYEVLPGREAYARIGDTKVNLADLSAVDRQRVLMAVKSKEDVARELETKREELDVLIAKRVALLTRIHLEDDGYSPAFFARTTKMAGHFYTYDALGDNRSGLMLSALPLDKDPYRAFYLVQLQNPSQTPGLSVLMFDGKPVYATFPADKDPDLVDAKWNQVSFIMSRELADPEPDIMVPRLMELRTYRLNAGRWIANPAATRNRLQGQQLASFQFILNRDKITPYEPAMRQEFQNQVIAARAYQTKMLADLDANLIRKVAEDKAAADEAKAAAEAAKIAATKVPDTEAPTAPVAVADSELTAKRVALYTAYKPVLDIWYSASNPPSSVLELQRTQMATKWTGNINMPTHIDGVPVLHMSTWQDVPERTKDRDRGIVFLGAKFRLLELKPVEQTGAPRFVMQVAIFANNTSTALARVRPQVDVTFKTDAKYDWLDADDLVVSVAQDFQMLPSWYGHLVLTKEVPVELVIPGMESLTLKILADVATPAAPAEGETPVKVDVDPPE